MSDMSNKDDDVRPDGTFESRLAEFGEPFGERGDVIAPGALAGTKEVPVLAADDLTRPVGTAVVRVDERGIVAAGVIAMPARDAVRFGADFGFGYRVLESRSPTAEERARGVTRIIEKVDVMNASVYPAPLGPALSEKEWRDIATNRSVASQIVGDRVMDRYGYFESVNRGDEPALIAACNALLPDSDPRKITRDKVNALREMVSYIDAPHEAAVRFARMDGIDDPSEDLSTVEAGRWLWRLADALESYLPPPKSA